MAAAAAGGDGGGGGGDEGPAVLTEWCERDEVGMAAAYAEAAAGLEEGGIPIGSALVAATHGRGAAAAASSSGSGRPSWRLLGSGRNQRVQRGSATLHGEMDALEKVGRQPASVYRCATLYTTLSPCSMCTGAMLLFGVRRVVVAERTTFQGDEELLKARGVTVVDAPAVWGERCQALMRRLIERDPTLWNEDIGEEDDEASGGADGGRAVAPATTVASASANKAEEEGGVDDDMPPPLLVGWWDAFGGESAEPREEEVRGSAGWVQVSSRRSPGLSLSAPAAEVQSLRSQMAHLEDHLAKSHYQDFSFVTLSPTHPMTRGFRMSLPEALGTALPAMRNLEAAAIAELPESMMANRDLEVLHFKSYCGTKEQFTQTVVPVLKRMPRLQTFAAQLHDADGVIHESDYEDAIADVLGTSASLTNVNVATVEVLEAVTRNRRGGTPPNPFSPLVKGARKE